MSGMIFRSLSNETSPENTSTMYSADPASEAQAGSSVIGSGPKRCSSPATRSGNGDPDGLPPPDDPPPPVDVAMTSPPMTTISATAMPVRTRTSLRDSIDFRLGNGQRQV